MATVRHFVGSPFGRELGLRFWNFIAVLASGLAGFTGYWVVRDKFPTAPRWMDGFTLILLVTLTNYVIKKAYNLPVKAENSLLETFAPSVEDRLDELERLKRRNMVTPEEYAAKRQEILKDL